ncbi:MAG: AraC family transcriptional regulator [Muribaculaceae bacterium]|nr:AraC family transcriptional regulator [Muribaculaceae bacterium]
MKKGNKTLTYEGLELPENLSHILEQDFWMLDNIGGAMLTMLRQPMKFTSATSIYVRKGHCKAEINLQEFDIDAPCLVNIGSSEILQPLSISEDFEGAFVVMSERFFGDLLKEVGDPTMAGLFKQNPVLNIPEENVTDFEMFLRHLRTIVSDPGDKFLYKSVLHTVLAFFYHTLTRIFNQRKDTGSTAAHITHRFLQLARNNFKKERFMEFYARELGITGKHLGRTIKAQTGFTASEWLDRMVILEAKVLLKSSSMSIQQIAEELNFPSQSFFGKYFKNIVGVSPKEFRNAR